MPYDFSGGQIMIWTASQKNIRWWYISSVPHHHQAVQTSVFGELQRTTNKNSARMQSTASKTTSTSTTPSSQFHLYCKPLYWWTSSANFSKGGFRLTKWISNSWNVIKFIPMSERAGSVKDLLLDQLPIKRALGVRWNVESDTFGFKISMKDRPRQDEESYPWSAPCTIR